MGVRARTTRPLWARERPSSGSAGASRLSGSKPRGSAGAAAISGALRWLDALWDAGLLAGVWRLRDAQRRWAEALEGEGPCAAVDACRGLGERLGGVPDPVPGAGENARIAE